jgi:two-component system, cell cycle sensor histidine kinase and response regulator CckA
MAQPTDDVESFDLSRPSMAEVEARAATRSAQRIASQLHQLIAASLTVTSLRSEREIVESLAGSARRVFDADDAVLFLQSADAPLVGVAQRSRLTATYEAGEQVDVTFPMLRPGTSAAWTEGDWIVAPIIAGPGEARGILAVRRENADFQSEDREVLTLLAQMAATSLSATELSRAIESSENRLRTLVDTAPAGIVEVDLEGTVLWWNRAARDIFDWPLYDDAMKPAPTFPASALEGLLALWSQVRKQTSPANRDLVEVDIRSRRHTLTASAVLLQTSDGSPSILMLVDDVTDHRQLKAEVSHAQQMEIRGRVASSVAHDFNNLLTLISGYAEILSTELSGDRDSLAMVRDIQSTASRASVLTSQLQTIGRSTSLEPMVFEPVAVLQNNANVIERIVGESISVSWSLDPQAGAILVDAGQFEQMVLNLAINARDAMPEGGELRITVGAVNVSAERASTLHLTPGTYVEIHIADSGVGMDAETVAQCFDTFFTTKGPYKGTGMGLAAARRLVEESHGTITAHSEPGVGTDFQILLPASDATIHEPEAASSVLIETGSASVLVAEDDDALRRLMVQILRRHGYEVTTAISGEAALDVARSLDGHLDLLVTDVVMGDLSGPDLASALQVERPALKILLTSGTADKSVTSHLAKGSSAFLAKPFRPTQFIGAVQELLSR